jgi:molybdopterin/thiamine biosynthesis adenylyltransferase
MSSKSADDLTPEERATYEWQMWLPGFGVEGQRKLKAASVLISRVGGVGGLVAYQLAAAGIGRLILAHAGAVRADDLNRQLLQTHRQIGHPRVENFVRRLHDLNPRVEIVAVPENLSDANAKTLLAQADVAVDAAPLFEERFALNRASVASGKAMVECAMYALEGQVTVFEPGRTGCLACLYPEKPAHWRREFPVLGAVSGTVACLAAVEVVKLLTGLGKPLAGTLLTMDLGTMHFRRHRLRRRPDCPVCSGLFLPSS